MTETVKATFAQLVKLQQLELDLVIPLLMSEDVPSDQRSCAGVLSVLNSAMTLLRRSRTNASLTIQLFSHLFQHINKVCFNLVLSQPRYGGNEEWATKMINRFVLIYILID